MHTSFLQIVQKVSIGEFLLVVVVVGDCVEKFNWLDRFNKSDMVLLDGELKCFVLWCFKIWLSNSILVWYRLEQYSHVSFKIERVDDAVGSLLLVFEGNFSPCSTFNSSSCDESTYSVWSSFSIVSSTSISSSFIFVVVIGSVLFLFSSNNVFAAAAFSWFEILNIIKIKRKKTIKY